MTVPSHPTGSALRARMIEDMSVRGFTEKTRHDYIRSVRSLAAFIGRSPAATLQPQPLLPIAFAWASATQQAFASTGAGSPQQSSNVVR